MSDDLRLPSSLIGQRKCICVVCVCVCVCGVNSVNTLGINF